MACSPTKRGDPEARDGAQAGQPRKASTTAAAADSRARDDEQADAEPAADVRDERSDVGERRQGGTVEQPEQEDRKRDRPEAGPSPPAAPHDRDTDHVVAPSRQCDAADGGGAAGGGQRQDGRPLLTVEKSRCQPHAFAA